MVTAKSRTKKTSTQRGQTQNDAIRLGFFGASGSGKTYRAKQLCKGLKRLVAFDPTPEVDWASETQDGVFYIDEAIEYIKNHFESGFRITIVPHFGQEVKELNSLCLCLISLQRKFFEHGAKITLVVDEMDLSFNSGIMLKNPRNYFGYLCRRGRHLGVNLLGLSQRINQVDTTFRANLSGVYLFQHTELIDIKQAQQLIGPAAKDKFLRLQPREYIYKQGNFQKIYSYTE